MYYEVPSSGLAKAPPAPVPMRGSFGSRKAPPRKFTRTVSVAALFCAGCGAGPALAQTIAQPNSSATSGADAETDEIVVTAQKRNENILAVPASVSVISAARLADQHATQLQDYAAYVPGFQVDSAGTPGQTTITLRGVAPIGPGSAVGTTIDDAPLGSSGPYALANSFQLDLLPYDLKNIQVLRGPQGTLYGASTLGGLIKYSLEPADVRGLHAAVGGDLQGVKNGDGVGGGARAMINVPIINDQLAVRMSGFYSKTPGYIDDPVQHKQGVNALRQWGGRFAIAWKPAPDVSVNLDALYQKISSDGDAVITLDPTGQTPVAGDLKQTFALSQPFTQKTAFLKGQVEWTLPFATLTSLTSYSNTMNLQIQDSSPIFVSFFPAVTGDVGYAPQTVNIHLFKFTQELRLASAAGGPLEWMIGGFLTTERVHNNQFIPALGPDFQPLNNVNPNFGIPLNPFLVASLPTAYNEQAIFGNLTWNVAGGFSVTGGLRYSHNTQLYSQNLGGLLLASAPPVFSAHSSDHVWTYSISAKYQFNPSTMLYARVASGYQPGGPNFGLAGIPPSVPASRTINYEAGFKARTLGGALMLDVSVFRIDWDKMITTATTSDGIGYLFSGGKARSQGVEGAAQLKLSRQFSLGGTIAYTDAKFTTSLSTLGTSAGQRLPSVPRLSASLNGEFQTPLGDDWSLDLTGGLRFTDDRLNYLFVAPNPPVTFRNAPYALADMNARISRDRWSFGLFAKNIFDKRAFQNKVAIPDAALGGVSEVAGSLIQPRMIGLSVDYRY